MKFISFPITTKQQTAQQANNQVKIQIECHANMIFEPPLSLPLLHNIAISVALSKDVSLFYVECFCLI